ncbi:MAG: hypothetical protein ABI318_10335 [Chthoniobacteraceae bacterium]
MPAGKPTPITPEGKRAAGRIRTIFFSVAAANIVLVAIVIWLGMVKKSGRTDVRSEAVAEMEAVFSRALAAYNAADRDGFLACFSARTGAAADDRARFLMEVEGGYRRDFGSVSVDKLIASHAADEGTRGGLVYQIACEKQPHAQLTAEFVRESGAMKLTGWRIERI